MRQATNDVFIEGILSENGLEFGSYTSKQNGQTVECIRGDLKILVRQMINGNLVDCEIPVNVFSNKLTSKGQPNPSYTNLAQAKESLASIASTGNEATADYVRIKGRIQMNEYYNGEGRLISFPRITASFVNKIRKDECTPKAEFTVEMFIVSQDYMSDAEGNPITDENGVQKYQITGIVPGYHAPGTPDKIDVMKFVCSNENVANSIRDYWHEQDTVTAYGLLNFSSRTVTESNTVGFGEVNVRSKTISAHDLMIKGGMPMPLEGDMAFDAQEVQRAIAERNAKLSAQKTSDMERARARQAASATATPAPASKMSFDLGF